MPGPTDESWVKAELKVAKARAKWQAPKHSDERQCTATTRAGRRCKAPRAPRDDGTLAPTCRMHGGAPFKSLESQAKALQSFIRYKQAQLKGLETKLAQVLEAIERERVMAGSE